MLTLSRGSCFVCRAAKPASACPMCKLANESDSRLPRAYMYSILFMIGMPMTVLSGFSIGFWRLSRKAARLQREAMEQSVAGRAIPPCRPSKTPNRAPPRQCKTARIPGLSGPGFVFP